MLDIQFIRDNSELVKEKSKQKGYKVDVDKLLKLDESRRKLIGEAEELRAKRNELSGGKKPDSAQITKGRELKDKIAKIEGELEKTEQELNAIIKTVPNIPTNDVPVGNKEEDNKVIKTVGEKTKFDFEPRSHAEIGTALGIIDKERAAKVAGSRFAYIKDDLVRLQFALIQFGLDVLANEEILKQIIKDNKLKVSSKPFMPILPPAVAKTDVYEATGRLNKEEQTYKLADDDLWLNASAEHTLAPMYKNEILDERDFPVRYVGYTTAFRREAGTYGKDTEGIFRLHQFDKLEMESFSTAEDSLQEHLFMIAAQEYLMQAIKLPYQVVLKCTAEIGGPNARGVDIETWLPSQNKYRETHTADLMTDYQARRLKTRVRRNDGQVEFAHTNDATAFAMGRTMVAIMENYQNKDGGFEIPDVLKPYLSKST